VVARITVEDCLKNVKNRFELVLIAAKRARQLMRGTADPKVAWDNDKPTVVALREIAAGYTQFDQSATTTDDSIEQTSHTKLADEPIDPPGTADSGDAAASDAHQE